MAQSCHIATLVRNKHRGAHGTVGLLIIQDVQSGDKVHDSWHSRQFLHVSWPTSVNISTLCDTNFYTSELQQIQQKGLVF